MLRKPVVGMRVRIVGIGSYKESTAGEVTCLFDADQCDTGTIIAIEKSKPRGHDSKFYSVQLDPPNFGVLLRYGTENLEELKEQVK